MRRNPETEYIIDTRHWVGPGVEALNEMLKTKAKGARSERKVREQLEEDGWYVVKAGGSLGLWDLVALHPSGNVRLIQVKTNRMPGTPEMEKLREFLKKWKKVEGMVAMVRDNKPTVHVLMSEGGVYMDHLDLPACLP